MTPGCSGDDLNLLHTGFASRSSVGDCINEFGVLVKAHSISMDEATRSFTSKINITVEMIPTMDITVTCYYDNGTSRSMIGETVHITPPGKVLMTSCTLYYQGTRNSIESSLNDSIHRLLRDLEGNMGQYSARGWQYCPY